MITLGSSLWPRFKNGRLLGQSNYKYSRNLEIVDSGRNIACEQAKIGLSGDRSRTATKLFGIYDRFGESDPPSTRGCAPPLMRSVRSPALPGHLLQGDTLAT